MIRPAVATTALALAVAGCGGGDSDSGGGDTTPRSETPTATPTPPATATPLPTPEPGTGVKAGKLRRCVSLWNEDVPRADDERAMALLGERVGKGETLIAAVTEYEGRRLKERRSSCVVAVTVDGRPVPPFSPVKGDRAWESDCGLVRARVAAGERVCPAYAKELLAAPNVSLDEQGRLRAR